MNKTTQALFSSNPEVVRKALRSKHAHVNELNEDGWSALHAAQSVEIASLLIDAGANVNQRGGSHGLTLLHFTPSPEVASLLIAHGADVMASRNGQSTPLHEQESLAVVELLIAHGADVNRKTKHLEKTPLHEQNESSEIVQLLIAHGADVHARDVWQHTPLHRALHPDVVTALIRSGADLNARNKWGSTPLWRPRTMPAWRSFSNAENAARMRVLLEAGCDPFARNRKGKMVKHPLAEQRREELRLRDLASSHRAREPVSPEPASDLSPRPARRLV